MFDFEINDGPDKLLVIFSGQLEGDDSEYGDEIDAILKKRNQPYKELVFLYPKYIENEILSFIHSGDRILSNADRATRSEQISFVSFDGYADLSLFYRVVDNVESIADRKVVLKTIVIQRGLLNLVEKRKDQVILKSPPGTIFEKPSKQKFNEFMKASELAVGFSENQFVAFTLLAHRPKRENKNLIQNIWIDTSGIAIFIEPLIYYIKKFNGDSCRRVKYHSFQSYGDKKTVGYETCIPDIKNDVWVIISASRTNSMGRDIYKVWDGLGHDQIVTLLSYSDTQYDQESLSYTARGCQEEPMKPGDQIVVNISRFSDYHNRERNTGSEVSVQIIGENFTAQVEEPNQVLLRKVHGVSAISTFIEPINQVNSFCVYKKQSNRLRSVFFDFNCFHNEESELRKGYLSWLEDVVQWYVPSSSCYVIYDFKDKASKLLYNDLVAILSCEDVVEVDINDIGSLEKSRLIIALSPVITRGHSFIKLNSDLRLIKHDAQRVFIAPFATPHTKRDFDSFEKSLVLGPRSLKYQFLNFRRIYIGHQEESSSWDRELEFLDKVDFKSPLWFDRTKVLQERSKGIFNSIGVSCNPIKDKLNFNIDFAFWKPGYDPDKVNPATVYLTISTILQGLREKPFTDFDKESLFTHVYQHAVLDPLNFSRFNDPLLQSCLWRCAYDGEVDYRTPNHLSRKFTDILIRLARSRSVGEHNATLDLLVGIAVGKIKISDDYLVGMLETLKSLLKDMPEFIEVLEYIDRNFSKPNFNDQKMQDAV